MPTHRPTVGIDISKHHLDVYIDPHDQFLRVANDDNGVAQVLEQLQKLKAARIVIEATGGYERNILFSLAQKHLPVALVNPRSVRNYARAIGLTAKTDKLDARVLATYARQVNTHVFKKPDENQQAIKELVTRRRQLVEQRSANRCQREHVTHELVRQSIARVIEQLAIEIQAIEVAICEMIQADETLQKRSETLQQVKGVGPAVASVLVTELPELGHLDRRRLASLVGVAPMNHDSGQYRGKRYTQGGRSTVRRALYMATLVACRHNHVIRAHYQHLLAQRKPKKVALVACMRKMLIYLNSLMKGLEPA